MKKLTICTMLLILSAISFSQQINPSQSFTKQEYLQKSKRQKNTAWILAGGGVILEISGAIAYKYGNASLFLFGTGLLSQVVSIPFFISSSINKKRAKKASLSFNFEMNRNIQPSSIGSHPFPSISLKLNL